MPATRVLVVDDAVVIRKIVTDALSADRSLEVVGTAPNGKIALAKIPQLNPDIVTLDVEMPVMDGLATLVELRRSYPSLPVIMFSTLTERGTRVTMDALFKGANDYVTKPANVGSVAAAMQRIREELVPKIHALCGAPKAASAPVRALAPPAAPARTTGRSAPQTPIQAVVVGVSTGGPNALSDLLPTIPADLGVPMLVVQHMPPMFTALLAERLDAVSPLRVSEALPRQPVRGGDVLIAPGGRHLEVRREGTQVVTGITDGPPENSCRPAVDVLFRTAVRAYHGGVLGVVLTGMGYDGRRGAQEINEAGGWVLAQDQASSVVWGMPGGVVEAGVADEILPLAEMGARITTLVGGRGRIVPGHPTEVAR